MPSLLVLKNAAGETVQYDFLANNTGKSTSYIGTEHSDLNEDSITLSSANPSRRVNDYGNRRSKANLQRSISTASPLGDAVMKNAKLECSASIPVGMTHAQFVELCARQAALLSNSTYTLYLFMQGRTEV